MVKEVIHGCSFLSPLFHLYMDYMRKMYYDDAGRIEQNGSLNSQQVTVNIKPPDTLMNSIENTDTLTSTTGTS